MKRYWASVCTIPERCDRTIWIVLGTSMSQSTPAETNSRTFEFQPFNMVSYRFHSPFYFIFFCHRIVALPFSLMMSIKMSITIKVPVRPIPALTTRQKNKCKHYLWASVHPVNTVFFFLLHCLHGITFAKYNKATQMYGTTNTPRAKPLMSFYLQCTTIGPDSRMPSCFSLTSSRKSSTPPGSVGTPWSGQARKWYCHTVRSVFPCTTKAPQCYRHM